MSKPLTTEQPFPTWVRTLNTVIAAAVGGTMVVVVAYGDVRSDVRNSQTVISEHSRRLERLDAALDRIGTDVADIKGDVRYLRAMRAKDERP